MSADLLAEFDSFYQAPTGQPVSSTAPSNHKPTSIPEELSFFETLNINPVSSNHPQPRSSETTSKPPESPWDHFGGFRADSTHQTATGANDPWSSFGQAENTIDITSRGNQSKNAGCEQSASDWRKPATAIPKPGIIRASTDELFSANIADLAESEAAQHDGDTGQRKMFGRGTRSEVLFDADEFREEEEEDDEFGDFETVGSPIPHNDLIMLEPSAVTGVTGQNHPDVMKTDESLTASSFPYPQAPRSPSFRERNPFADLLLSTSPIAEGTKVNRSAEDTPVTAWPSYEPKSPTIVPYVDSPIVKGVDDDDWGEFAELPPKVPESSPSEDIEADDAWTWDAVDNPSVPTSTAERLHDLPPPTNIPPPSILLSLFTQLLDLPQSGLLQAIASQPLSLRNRVLPDPSMIDFLRSYIVLATVAARIIAGKKLRWKRDTHLSQAMKIGPANAHGKGGMKLSGVDKAETSKEDGESLEVIRVWKKNIGSLRYAVAAANSSLLDPSADLVVPEIVETMTVKVEGVLNAPKACIICGLRREERIPKVDYHVEDSFGEWWVEHWGHRACKNFWEKYENELRSR